MKSARSRFGISAKLIATSALVVIVTVAGFGMLSVRDVHGIQDRNAAEQIARYRDALEHRGKTTTQVFAQALLPLLLNNQDEEISGLVAKTAAQDPSLTLIYVLGRDKSVIAYCPVTPGQANRACGASPYASHAAITDASWSKIEAAWKGKPADSKDVLVSVEDGSTLLYAYPVFIEDAATAAGALAPEASEQRWGYLAFGYDLGPIAEFAAASERAKAAAASAAVRRAALAGGGFVLIGCVLAVLQGVGLARPIRLLVRKADQIAGGDLDVQIDMKRGDEIGQLAGSFGAMVAAVRARDEELRHHNETLEQTVQARTRHIALILDSTGDGLISVDLDGTVRGQVSAAAAHWFGAPAPGVAIWDYLAAGDSSAAGMMMIGMQQIADDLMPFELSAEQMPRRIQRGDQVIELTWKQVMEDGRFVHVLVIAADVTRRIAAEKAEAESREIQTIVGHILRDRAGFGRFVAETDALLADVRTSRDPVVTKRLLHTLKGNTSIFGFTALAAAVHALEDLLVEEPDRRIGAELADIEAQWERRRGQVSEYFSEDLSNVIFLSRDEHSSFLRRLEQREDPKVLVPVVKSWQQEPVQRILEKLGAHAAQIAERRGKQLDVVVDAGTLRVDADELAGFWSNLVHVVRNAVDHGIELPDVRSDAGKPATGTLTLAARQTSDGLEVVIGDDGAGIDWDRIREKATGMGVRAQTVDDLEAALFADGLSTASEVSDLSGRGVGMSAVRAAVLAAGGEMGIESERGRGTTMRFRLRRAAARAAS
jgi:two-component system chemotaxis sensor kinase CheA